MWPARRRQAPPEQTTANAAGAKNESATDIEAAARAADMDRGDGIGRSSREDIDGTQRNTRQTGAGFTECLLPETRW